MAIVFDSLRLRTPRPASAPPAAHARIDRPVWAPLLLSVALLYLPTYWSLATTVWAYDEQSYGPVLLITSLWLLFARRDAIAAAGGRPLTALGSALLAFGLLMYAVGRSQGIWVFEAGSQIPVFAALLLMFCGARSLGVAAFPLLILLFTVPLPGVVVATLTAPLKAAVSMVATVLLRAVDFPAANSGVVLTIGQYQLLVADACAGLNSMFSLEALTLVYLSIAGHASAWRRGVLAVLALPISFVANVVRVFVLSVVTYQYGDAAGQGFVHGFAGVLLFLVALSLTMLVDRLLGAVPSWRDTR